MKREKRDETTKKRYCEKDRNEMMGMDEIEDDETASISIDQAEMELTKMKHCGKK